MSQREMRKQTENKYRKCPEVKNKKVEIKRKEEYITNKLMAKIFNKVNIVLKLVCKQFQSYKIKKIIGCRDFKKRH